tara:strand:+ start:505 stop:711 length:207 start_codon:yes stop_codon:yes gene_type:complete
MCDPLLTGGLVGYGISQAGKKKDPKETVTNNYYNTGSTPTEEAPEGTNKNQLKTSGAPSQSSRINKAY